MPESTPPAPSASERGERARLDAAFDLINDLHHRLSRLESAARPAPGTTAKGGDAPPGLSPTESVAWASGYNAAPKWPTMERVRELATGYLDTVAIGEQLSWASRLADFFSFVRERERAGKGADTMPESGYKCSGCGYVNPDPIPTVMVLAKRCLMCSAPGDEAAREGDPIGEYVAKLPDSYWRRMASNDNAGKRKLLWIAIRHYSPPARFPRPADSRERERVLRAEVDAWRAMDAIGEPTCSEQDGSDKCDSCAARDKVLAARAETDRLAAVLGKGKDS